MKPKLKIGLLIGVLGLQLLFASPEISVVEYRLGEISSKPNTVTDSNPTQTQLSGYTKDSYSSLIFVGDVLLARNVEVLMNRYGENYSFAGLALTSFSQDAAVIGNFESTVPPKHRMTKAFKVAFSTDKKFLPALYSAGYTHLSLANNHSLDFGEDAYVNTVSELSSAGLVSFGHGEKLSKSSVSYIETSNGKIALVGINASISIPDTDAIESVFAEAKSNSILQVAYVHWGNEYDISHSKVQERLAKLFIAQGADLIVGHHPHVVQDVDIIDGVLVFYSLGNYIFDQYFSTNTQEGLILSLQLEDAPSVSMIPVTSAGSLSQPKLMDSRNHRHFLSSLAKRSDSRLKDAITAGVIPLFVTVATSTKTAMMLE